MEIKSSGMASPDLWTRPQIPVSLINNLAKPVFTNHKQSRKFVGQGSLDAGHFFKSMSERSGSDMERL